MENLPVQGRTQVEIAAASAEVSAAVLASMGILQGELAVVVLSCSLPLPLPLPASSSSQPNAKGLQGHCIG